MKLADTGWKQLTSHQQIRKLTVSDETRLSSIREYVLELNDPFEGKDSKGQITWRVSSEDPGIVHVHAQKVCR